MVTILHMMDAINVTINANPAVTNVYWANVKYAKRVIG